MASSLSEALLIVPILPIETVLVSKRKRAIARIRDGVIEITLPKHWPSAFKAQVIQQLASQMQAQYAKDWQLVAQWPPEALISFEKKADFCAWVNALNVETVGVPLVGIRMGHAKHTHLAQMNTQTRMMTVSKYCLNQVPPEALRYLVIHELVHLEIANHTRAFWSRVAEFVPDYKTQRKVIAAFHRIRGMAVADTPKKSSPKPFASVKKREQPGPIEQLLLWMMP